MMNTSSWLRCSKLLQRIRTTSTVTDYFTSVLGSQAHSPITSKIPETPKFDWGTHNSNHSTNGKLYIKGAAALLGFGTLVYLVQRDKIGWPFVVHAAKPIEKDIYSGSSDSKPSGAVENKLFPVPNISRRIAYNVIADVVDETALAVVCIHCRGVSSDYFGGQRQTQNDGSGFIVSSDGLIVTNAHVVENATHNIEVQLQNEQKFSGYIVALDRASDIALIRINAKGLPVLKLGNSADTRLGETVVAIGSPLSLSNSVTSGIVSSFRSAIQLGRPSNLSYIQTDAPITFGNSGGPLVNLDGEAIGVNTMTMAPGISFAIPINHVKQFMAKVESDKRAGVHRKQKYVGFTLLPLTKDIAANFSQQFGYTCPSSQGAMVVQVVRESPAYRAGIHPGDIIEQVNGKDVYDGTEINESVERYDELRFIVNRKGTLFQCIVQPEHVI